MYIKEITSVKNDIVLKTKKLKNKKYREQTGTFLAEGEKNVKDSMRYASPKAVFVTEREMVDFECDCPLYIVSPQVMKELSDTVTPQGIMAVFEMKAFDENNLSDKILVLNGVSDPGNVGTILRTACALGFSTVISDSKTADIYSPKIIRSAMSAIFSLNILRTDNLEDCILNLKKSGYTFYVSLLSKNSSDINKTDFSEKLS